MIDRSLNYGRHLIDEFLGRLGSYTTVLDLGAGHGNDLAIAKRREPDCCLHAIESCLPYVKELQDSGVTVHQFNIERDTLPFPSQSVDVVIANQILEHTKELYWIFHEITRVLKQGGGLIIGVPNLASLHNRLLLAMGRQPTPIKSASAHVRGFTKNDLLHFLESCYPCGYTFEGFGGSNFYPFPSFLARPLSGLFPTFSWAIFFLFVKRIHYTNEFLEFPVKEALETNFYLGL